MIDRQVLTTEEARKLRDHQGVGGRAEGQPEASVLGEVGETARCQARPTRLLKR